jgi:hypothetical protein
MLYSYLLCHGTVISKYLKTLEARDAAESFIKAGVGMFLTSLTSNEGRINLYFKCALNHAF